MSNYALLIFNAAFAFVLFMLAMYQAFFKSYFTEKGKNVATQEDIAGITQQVEAVKNEFSKDLEQLRTDLQYKNQMRISLRGEEKKAIVECFEAMEVLRHFSSVKYLGYDEDNYEEIMSTIKKLDDYYTNYKIAEAKTKLYVGNSDLVEMLLNAGEAIFKQYRLAGSHYLKYRSELALYKIKIGNEKDLEQMKQLMGEHERAISALMDTQGEEHRPIWADASDKILAFRKAAYQHLLSMEAAVSQRSR
ncbi:hypothetical protein F0P96_18540 [Hymenobacter busanensis]|uniref:Uncharacterized protein n=1 Tax=Hymenobacter busanensis TaxID=2607656 RepID=A0A7L4ZS79_9BACT|nr:hypothetical protein [Hymenobacter busanensis]KAA9327232.1 hypothetical protein F0P96_18540 [Hymenobacter busanensis]QHJ05898.1 hypothetical protein GUY19_00745 [Hymenobacter busanensis]